MLTRISLALVLATVVPALACAPEGLDPVNRRPQAIVDGAESDRPGVVLLRDLSRGGQCTGALIAPRVVLTAKHCVASQSGFVAPARAVQVLEGTSLNRIRQSYGVEEVRVAPGSFSINSRDASDVALLILTTPAGGDVLEASFDVPSSLFGETITAVGYGQTPSGNRISQQFETQKRVVSVLNGAGVTAAYIQVEPAVCQGDSGGPLIGPDGRIWGVASFIVSPDGRSAPSCGPSPGFYNAIHHLRGWIEEAVEDSGVCIPDEEVCNGLDDDCDEEVDEVCTPLGEPCSADDECIGGLCDETPLGRVCTAECDPRRPGDSCTPGLYCARMDGCEGRCIPRQEVATPKLLGEPCESDSECASFYCRDPGDGNQRCLQPCGGDEGTCFYGEVCVAAAGGCAGCVDAALVSSPRGLGEACSDSSECRNGATCVDERGVRYCAASCAVDEECGDGFYCRGMRDGVPGLCIRGLRGGLGDACIENGDCGRGTFCATSGARSWCTRLCTEGGDECPEDTFRCTEAEGGRVCEPVRSLVGESCVASEDCISGLCAGVGNARVCTRFCGPELACAPGLECVATGSADTAVCILPTPTAEEGGCAAGTERPVSLVGLLALLLVLLRRRTG